MESIPFKNGMSNYHTENIKYKDVIIEANDKIFICPLGLQMKKKSES